MNPIDWCKALFEITGGNKHPLASLTIFVVVAAFLGAACWKLGANASAKERIAAADRTESTKTSQTGAATATGTGNGANSGNGGTVNVKTVESPGEDNSKNK